MSAMPYYSMDVNNTETTGIDPSTNTRSVFFCPQYPHFSWDLKSTTTSWILVFIIAIASPVTILLNLLVIVAVKRRKELQKPVNILLSSMAVADFLVGTTSMPLSATIDIFILRQASLQHICTLDSVINKPMLAFLCSSSLYHLTAVAGERYVAIQKYMHYKVIVTKGLLRKLSIAAWLFAMFTLVAACTMALFDADRRVMQIRQTVEGVMAIICLITIVYFYTMVYLGVRKRTCPINGVSQVNDLIKAKLESKVAKTTGMLVTALILSSLPAIGIALLGNIPSVFETNSFFRLGEALPQLNSLVSPILYCYRDRKFRKSVLELLGMRKPHESRPAVDPALFVRRKRSFGSVAEIKKAVDNKRSREIVPRSSNSIKNDTRYVCLQRRTRRSASCDAVIFVDCGHFLAKPHERRKLSSSI